MPLSLSENHESLQARGILNQSLPLARPRDCAAAMNNLGVDRLRCRCIQQHHVVVVTIVVLADADELVFGTSDLHCFDRLRRTVKLHQPRLLGEWAERPDVGSLELCVSQQIAGSDLDRWLCSRRDVAIGIALSDALPIERGRHFGHGLRRALDRGKESRGVAVEHEDRSTPPARDLARRSGLEFRGGVAPNTRTAP